MHTCTHVPISLNESPERERENTFLPLRRNGSRSPSFVREHRDHHLPISRIIYLGYMQYASFCVLPSYAKHLFNESGKWFMMIYSLDLLEGLFHSSSNHLRLSNAERSILPKTAASRLHQSSNPATGFSLWLRCSHGRPCCRRVPPIPEVLRSWEILAFSLRWHPFLGFES